MSLTHHNGLHWQLDLNGATSGSGHVPPPSPPVADPSTSQVSVQHPAVSVSTKEEEHESVQDQTGSVQSSENNFQPIEQHEAAGDKSQTEPGNKTKNQLIFLGLERKTINVDQILSKIKFEPSENPKVSPPQLEKLVECVKQTLKFIRDITERLVAVPISKNAISLHKVSLLLREKLIDVWRYLVQCHTETRSNPPLRTLIIEVFLGLQAAFELTHLGATCAGNNLNNDPMGLDLLTRFRQILTGWHKPKEALPGTSPEEAGGGTGGDLPAREDPPQDLLGNSARKRRYQDNDPRLIKYRKVDNSFPRFVANEAAEDYPPARLMSEREREPMMAQRNNTKRMSIFDSPKMVQYRVRFGGNSPLDFSDEDDDELQQIPRFANNSGGTNNTVAALTASSSSSRPLQAASSLNHGSGSLRTSMLYSDAVRLGQNGFNDSRINGHGEDSVIAQEEQRSEREQYLSLIRNLCYDKSTVRPATPAKTTGISWSSILGNNNKQQERLPLASERQQQPPENCAYTNYAKLLAQADEAKPAPAPIQPYNSVNSATSHASTISHSDASTSSDAQSVVITGIDDSSEDISDQGEPNTSATAKTSGGLNTSLNNSLVARFAKSLFFQDDYTEQYREKALRQRKEMELKREQAIEEYEKLRQERCAYEVGLRETMLNYRLPHKPIFVIGSIERKPEPKESTRQPLTDELLRRFTDLMQGAAQQVLISKFNMNIHRSDIRTLLGGKWLNDEVINFYMNMITDRSERRAGQLPSVYAMNTFFVPRLLQNGHDGVKRWTRKVDLFSKDIIPVPVHCNGVHWCMAIIHMRDRTIRYYDSMGKPNQPVLDALEAYLRSESLDKRKKPFDTSCFRIESMPDVPQQTNGSDCGVFSCTFAEYITRDRPFNFSQEDMDYFRKKMVLEICGGELWL
ncbi:uncharacterized protein Ulp1 isoform X2 [Drosophila bipectinata]|nr:uncharacterized protein LOC108119435 [Drosophila bipectinata]